MSNNKPQFSIISLDAFLEKSVIVDYVYNNIILSEWVVNSLSSSYHLSVGLKGTTTLFDDDVSDNKDVVFFVNGSSYFHGNCKINNDLTVLGNTIFENIIVNNLNINNNLSVYSNSYFNNDILIKGIVDISSNLIVRDNVLLYSNLDVSDNTSTNTLYVNNNSLFNSNVSINGLVDISNSLIVSGPVSFNSSLSVIGKSFFHDNVIIDTNVSSPKLYINDIATINNLSVLQNASITTLYVNNTSTNNLYVDNNSTFNNNVYINNIAVINNLSVPFNSVLNNLNVSGTTHLTSAHVIGNTTLNNVSINGPVVSNLIESRTKIFVGGYGLMSSTYSQTSFEVNKTAYISTLYSDKIICNDIKADLTTNEIVNTGITKLSVLNNIDISNGVTSQIYAEYVFGEIDSTVLTNTYTYGIFSHGLSTFDTSYNYDSTFDLSANAESIGIQYNGPINIGMNTSNVFNLNATTGIINYGGSMNIGQNVLSEFNLNASGIMKYDGIINIGSNTDTYLDICANSLTTGITYNGPVNINSQNLNINGTGMIDYTGIINMNGPIYIEYDGDITLDVIGNTKIDGNLLLGGNITSYSDIKIKDNICKLTSCLTKIEHITGYSFTRKDLVDKDKIYIGLIAQEVEQTFPDLVTETNDIKSINYQSMIAVLLECIKELKEDIKELKEKFMN